jgi:predicted dehydrogenase
MKFLIVGFGSIGRRHFHNLLSLGEKDIYFYRTHQSTLEDIELADYQVETDLKSALAQEPDAIIIANPSAYHLDVAIPAAQQGCHILLEKPISHSMSRVEEFSKAVQESGSRVLVGFQFRYHPDLIKIKELLDNKNIGRVLSFRSHWGEYLPNWHPWEDYRESYAARNDLGGGVLLTLCHNFDYLRWLFCETRVHSALLGYNSGLGIEVEDTAEVSLVCDHEVQGSLHLNFTQKPGKHYLEIIGSRGSIYWDYYQNQVILYTFNPAGELNTKIFSTPDGFDRNDLFIQEMKHFIDLIKGNADPVCSLTDGIKALELSIQAKVKGAR